MFTSDAKQVFRTAGLHIFKMHTCYSCGLKQSKNIQKHEQLSPKSKSLSAKSKICDAIGIKSLDDTESIHGYGGQTVSPFVGTQSSTN